jgi:hypothetical protein
MENHPAKSEGRRETDVFMASVDLGLMEQVERMERAGAARGREWKRRPAACQASSVLLPI